MRKTFTCFIALCAYCIVSSAAWGEKLIYEPFDYPTPGVDLLGLQNTSSGWAASGNSWLRAAPIGQEAESIDITSGSLSGPSELKTSIGNSISIVDGTFNGPADRLAIRSDGSVINTTSPESERTIYYSFLLQVDSLVDSNNVLGDYFISLNNTANTATSNNPTVAPGRMMARIDPNDGTKFSLGMFTNRTPSSTDDAWVDGLTVGDTMFIVGAFNIVSGTVNSTKLWINPDPLTFGLALPPVSFTAEDTTGASNGGTVGSLLLHQRNAAPGLTLDEIRVATTWGEVTPLGAPTLYWDIDGTTPGAGGATPSGIWDTSTSNWNENVPGDGAAVTWDAGGAAVFSAGSDATGAYTITVSGTQTANAVTFEDGTVTLTGGTLALTGALHTIITNSGVTANVESVVGGSVGFVKDGAGTLVLTANESYSGPTTVNGGSLQLGNGGTTGTLPTGSAITTNARLTTNRSNAVTQGTDFSGSPITGTGGVTQAGSGTLTLNAANTYGGTTRATAGTISVTNSLAMQNSTLDMDGTDAGAVSFDSSLSAVTLGGITGSRNLSLLNSASGPLAVNIGSSISPAAPYTGVLSGSGSSVTKNGASTQVLSGANTYGGGTNINSGVLQFATTFAMPATGNVTVNSGGTLTANSNGTDEWTDSADTSVGGSIGALIAGRGGQGTANQVIWMPGSTLAIDTTNAPGGAVTYSGVIGSFHSSTTPSGDYNHDNKVDAADYVTWRKGGSPNPNSIGDYNTWRANFGAMGGGSGITDNVGFTKLGLGTLTLDGDNTFSGPLTVAGGVNGTSTSTLVLNGTALNAGTAMTIPTVDIDTFSTLQLAASERLPSGSLIQTLGPQAKLHLNDGVAQTIRSLSGTRGIIEVGLGRLNIDDQAGDDYILGSPGGAYIQSSDGAFDPNLGIIYKTGAGTLTLEGDAGANFQGTFVLENGTLKLSRNQALGNAASGRLVVKGGQLARSDTPTGNFTYSVGNVDLDVFRYDLSDDPARTSQFNAATLVNLKQDDVEINITNSGPQTGSSGRFIFQQDIRNLDPNPSAGDNPNAVRGITKTGNGVLLLSATNTYKGSTTVMDGVLLVNATSTLGDYNQATIGTLSLKGGLFATADNRSAPIKNPMVVDGNAAIGFFGSGGQTDVGMEFDNDSIVGNSGSLTLANLNSNTSTSSVFRPRFTGSGFDFARPITISDAVTVGTGVKTTELQSGNTTGTQTFSGVISGGGSFRRVNAGGTTILSGSNTYTGDTFVDAGTLSITNPFLANTADVLLLTGGVLDLNFIGTDTIDQLFFDGFSQATGTWGATGSGATNIDDTFFSGMGVLMVSNAGSGSGFDGLATVPEPNAMALALFAVGLILRVSDRRLRRPMN